MAVIPPLTLLETPVPLRVTLLVGNGLVNVPVTLIVSVKDIVLAGEVPVGKGKVRPLM